MKIRMNLIIVLLIIWGIITFLIIYLLINNPESKITTTEMTSKASDWWSIGGSFLGTIIGALMVIYAVNSSNKNAFEQSQISKKQIENQLKNDKLNALVDFEYLFYDFVMTQFRNDIRHLNKNELDSNQYNNQCKQVFENLQKQLIELEYNPKSLVNLSYRGRKAYRGLYLEYKKFSAKITEYSEKNEFSKEDVSEDFHSYKLSQISNRIRVIGFETELIRRDVENLGEIANENEWFNGLYLETHENGFLINMKRYPRMKVWNEYLIDENSEYKDMIKLKYELLENEPVSKIDIQEALTRARYNFKRAYINNVFKHTGDEPWVWGAVVE